jgi:RNA polymerase sigma-70 factor (ECF subfamily)
MHEVDHATVERARGGDPDAMGTLLASIAPSVQRFGMRMCKNPADADDVLQDTLLSIAQHLGEFEGRSSLSSWVFTLVRTACGRRRRGLKNRPAEADDVLAQHVTDEPTPEEGAASRELSVALTRALDALSDEHREVILLRDVEGLTAPEAAEVLGVGVDALKSRLHRARSALRDALRPVLEPSAARPPAAGVVSGPDQAPCPDVIGAWSRKLEGELSSVDCATMEEHVAACPSCGPACDALRQALRLCKSAAAGPVEPAVRARVKAALQAWQTSAR